MIILETKILSLKIAMINSIPKKIRFSLPTFKDNRGSLSLMRCSTINDIPSFFSQEPNQIFISTTKPWRGRGLHFQKESPLLQTVTVVEGSIYECLVETKMIKKTSTYNTYRNKISASDELNSFIVPKGWAHGFFTKFKSAIILYQVWGTRDENDEYGYNMRDPKFNLLTHEEGKNLRLNKRDSNFKLIK